MYIRVLIKIFLIFGLNFGLAASEERAVPEKVAILSPELAGIMTELGLGEKIACSAQPSALKNVKPLGPYHKPNIELVVECKPDLVISTYSGTPPYVHKKLKSMGFNIINYKPVSLESIMEFISKLAGMFRVDPKPVLSKFDNLCVKQPDKKGLMLIGLDPVYAVGNKTFVSDALKCAGFINMVKGNYPRLSLEKILKDNPDYIIVALMDPGEFSDFKKLKRIFKGKIILINPDNILQASPAIIKG
ncbi:MAG: hypothetical protein JXA66_01145, partial [Oligoflexia bacterium]|nr:hypothetical protein [Oligoflexia bacterium]